MVKNEIIKYLSKFTPITKELEMAIAESTVFRTFEKGSVLLKAGDMAKECFFVIQGCMRSYFLKDGEEITMEYYLNEESAVPTAYGTSVPSEHYLACLTDTVVSVGNPKLEEDTFHKYPQLASLSRKIAESVLRKQQESHAHFRASTPEERYLEIMKNRPNLIQIAPQYQLASYLGIKPESLSRIRKRIADKKGS